MKPCNTCVYWQPGPVPSDRHGREGGEGYCYVNGLSPLIASGCTLHTDRTQMERFIKRNGHALSPENR